jgi:uncharacterized protein (TIGR02217 family)
MTFTANYIDHRLSQKATNSFRRVVTGKTNIVSMASGRERRNAAWAFKKMTFTASFALLLPDVQDEVYGAYYAANGQLLLFRFRDPADWKAKDSPLLVSSDLIGTTTPVQLTKRYLFGPAYADRTIQAVSTCFVKTPGGSDFPGTIDHALGMFTPDGAWGSGQYTWSGTFDLWVRFNSDELDVTMTTLDVATTDVELVEQIATNFSGS